MTPAPCGTLPPPHLAIDIPERGPPLHLILVSIPEVRVSMLALMSGLFCCCASWRTLRDRHGRVRGFPAPCGRHFSVG